MPIDTTKTFEVENGVGVVGAASVYSDVGAPAFSAVNGSLYLQTDTGANPPVWIRRNGTWVKLTRAQINISITASLTNNSTFTTMGYFVFQGTDRLGQPVSSKFLIRSTDASTSVEARVIRSSNGAVITSVSGVAGQNYQIFSGSAFTNLPAGQEIFEIQLRRVSGILEQVALSAFSMEF